MLKDATREEIRRAIQAVGNGEAIFSPAIAARLIAFFANPPLSIPKSMFPELTHREKEILDRVAKGESSREIAQRLALSA